MAAEAGKGRGTTAAAAGLDAARAVAEAAAVPGRGYAGSMARARARQVAAEAALAGAPLSIFLTLFSLERFYSKKRLPAFIHRCPSSCSSPSSSPSSGVEPPLVAACRNGSARLRRPVQLGPKHLGAGGGAAAGGGSGGAGLEATRCAVGLVFGVTAGGLEAVFTDYDDADAVPLTSAERPILG